MRRGQPQPTWSEREKALRDRITAFVRGDLQLRHGSANALYDAYRAVVGLARLEREARTK